jgi:hypothetical protein
MLFGLHFVHCKEWIRRVELGSARGHRGVDTALRQQNNAQRQRGEIRVRDSRRR